MAPRLNALLTVLGLASFCSNVFANENVEEALPGIVKTEYAYNTPIFVKKAYVDRMGAPLPDDIFVASWPKSGTHWMKQLVHAIRIRGDPKQAEEDSKIDLSDIVPYLEADPNVTHNSLMKPRAYHTHLKYEDLPKPHGGRIIYVMRDLPDVAVSFYKYVQQFEGMLVNNSVDEVANMMMAGVLFYGLWQDHIKSYWDVRDRPDVLMVKFEDMKKNAKGVIAQVAKFMGASLDAKEKENIKRLVSFEYMKRNAKRIGGLEWSERVTGMKVDPDFKLVNDGLGAKGVFTPEMLEKLRLNWVNKAKPLFGAASYQDLKLPEAVPVHDEF